jgi:hypothetical protein
METAMMRTLCLMVSAASIAVLAGAPAFAQTGRMWTDPPPLAAAPSGSIEETTPAATQPLIAEPAAPAAPRSPRATSLARRTAPTASLRNPSAPQRHAASERIAAPGKNRQAVQAGKRNRPTALAAGAGRPLVLERRFVEGPAPDPMMIVHRNRTVRSAVRAGLAVTTIRTIEFPDGRRMQIITQPDPETELDFLTRPY